MIRQLVLLNKDNKYLFHTNEGISLYQWAASCCMSTRCILVSFHVFITVLVPQQCLATCFVANETTDLSIVARL